jgi:beta-galactosidase
LQIGLKGESLGVQSAAGASSVEWGGAAGKQPLTWHKVSVST